MQTAVTAIVTASAAVVIWSHILFFMLRKWIGAQIEQSIKHSHDLHLEKVREEISIKNRAVLVADLLSEWLSCPQDNTRLNRMTFEAFLWLPQGIAEDLSKRLTNLPGAPDIRTPIGQARKRLIGGSDGFDPEKVIIFPPRGAGKTAPEGDQEIYRGEKR
jgi:hypothetical protein